MASYSPHPQLHISLSAQSSFVFHEEFLDCLHALCSKTILNHVMYFMFPAVVCIVLKINCHAFWCFLSLLCMYDDSLNGCFTLMFLRQNYFSSKNKFPSQVF